MGIDVSRVVNTESITFQMELLTPTFLGGANQNAELRTPPFKSALRYWWRLTQGNNASNLLPAEEALWGGTRTENAGKSPVSIAIEEGNRFRTYQTLPESPKIHHPEAHRNIPVLAYLGMGPVGFDGTTLNHTPMKEGTAFKFKITLPKRNINPQAFEDVMNAVSLFRAFGSLGSRSRNGWGSFQIKPQDGQQADLKEIEPLFSEFEKDFREILKGRDKYPISLGKDQKGSLLWESTHTFTKWIDAFEFFATEYLNLRVELDIKSNMPADRHLLGYPVTHHKVNEWKANRLPSQLRMFVRKEQDGLRAYFLHLPYPIPLSGFNSDRQIQIWGKVHEKLDASEQIQRAFQE